MWHSFPLLTSPVHTPRVPSLFWEISWPASFFHVLNSTSPSRTSSSCHHHKQGSNFLYAQRINQFIPGGTQGEIIRLSNSQSVSCYFDRKIESPQLPLTAHYLLSRSQCYIRCSSVTLSNWLTRGCLRRDLSLLEGQWRHLKYDLSSPESQWCHHGHDLFLLVVQRCPTRYDLSLFKLNDVILNMTFRTW